MKPHEITVTKANLVALEVPHPASMAMIHVNEEARLVGDNLVVAYLADDKNPKDPSKQDINGLFYELDLSKAPTQVVQLAMAITSSWEPSHVFLFTPSPLLSEFKVCMWSEWLSQAAESHEFQSWALGTTAESKVPFNGANNAYFKARATEMLRQQSINTAKRLPQQTLPSFGFNDQAVENVWAHLREQRLIGDPDLIMLSVNPANGSWRLADEGVTSAAECDAIWLPTPVQKDIITEHSETYSFGYIERVPGIKRIYMVFPDDCFEQYSPSELMFTSWTDAYDWLARKAEGKLKTQAGKVTASKNSKVGRTRAARELAAQAVELYNDFNAGACYGYVVATYKNANAGTQINPQWEYESSLNCWGYMGHHEAMSEGTHVLDSVCNSLRFKTAA